MGDRVTFTRGYFRASLDDGELVMEPFCRCGEPLGEDYHCGSCAREVRIAEFRCQDAAVLARVQQVKDSNPSFADFKAVIEDPAS